MEPAARRRLRTHTLALAPARSASQSTVLDSDDAPTTAPRGDAEAIRATHEQYGVVRIAGVFSAEEMAHIEDELARYQQEVMPLEAGPWDDRNFTCTTPGDMDTCVPNVLPLQPGDGSAASLRRIALLRRH